MFLHVHLILLLNEAQSSFLYKKRCLAVVCRPSSLHHSVVIRAIVFPLPPLSPPHLIFEHHSSKDLKCVSVVVVVIVVIVVIVVVVVVVVIVVVFVCCLSSVICHLSSVVSSATVVAPTFNI